VTTLVTEVLILIFSLLANTIREEPDTSIICRAYYKIKEVVDRVPLKLEKSMRAIDIGAAPGGWTHYLSKYVGEVIAVDSAELKIQLTPNIKHLKMKAEDALLLLAPNSFDLLVCDINHCSQVLLNSFEKLQPFVKERGIVVLTIKMPKRKPDTIIEQMVQEFKNQFLVRFKDFEILIIYWLLANINERCLVAQRK